MMPVTIKLCAIDERRFATSAASLVPCFAQSNVYGMCLRLRGGRNQQQVEGVGGLHVYNLICKSVMCVVCQVRCRMLYEIWRTKCCFDRGATETDLSAWTIDIDITMIKIYLWLGTIHKIRSPHRKHGAPDNQPAWLAAGRRCVW